MRSPGERVLAGRATASLSSPNLASSERASCWEQPALRDERVEQRAGPVEADARLVERADAHAGADPARARGERRAARSARRPASSSRSRSGRRARPARPTPARGRAGRARSCPAAARRRRAARSRRPSARRRRSAAAAPSAATACRPSSSRSIAFSVARTFAACFSERSARLDAADLVGVVAAPTPWPCARRSPTTGAGAGRDRRAGRARWRRSRSAPRRGARPSRAARGSRPSRRRTPTRCARSRRARARA